MIVLDTNVISELMRPGGESRVVTWVDARPAEDLYLTAVTTAELHYGVERLPDGRRRSDLAERLRRIFVEAFAGRILAFDAAAATHYAEVVLARERRGLVITTADAQIAAICRSRSAGLATRNTRDFTHTGIQLVDPWKSIDVT
jgi:toxin FitB